MDALGVLTDSVGHPQRVILGSHSRWVHLRECLVSHKQKRYSGVSVSTQNRFSEIFLSTRRKFPEIALECQSLWIVEVGTPPRSGSPQVFGGAVPNRVISVPKDPPQLPENSDRRVGIPPSTQSSANHTMCRPLSSLETVRRSLVSLHSWFAI